MGRLGRLLAMLVVLGGCSPAEHEPPPESAALPESPTLPELDPEPSTPTPASAPLPPAPAPPTFDALLASDVTVRVLEVAHDNSWTACGVIHSTGAIVVEVLEVGEPRPQMILIVSCPVDFGHRQLLVVGKTLKVGLHAKRQPWPKPAALTKLSAELPRRWVETMIEIDTPP